MDIKNVKNFFKKLNIFLELYYSIKPKIREYDVMYEKE